ncbi:hypothetical protein L249_8415 [Ophiocordyceps polyrhachis-furcata BCC 54312]|uniref:Uncharacterized protein n=1 Tax=Ophiocordyceps polyrhachis-furcata BCC 54312 TaxID=1330021 RepID=A0A367L6S7_9HYPO|nr:hypothetical protein L249_8415 [Ophiocordyceps polyrhachis-furcata BCC 54312]
MLVLRSSTRAAFICRPCRRSFVTTAASLAGHNKWSKTKHIKAVTDKKKMAERTTFAKLISMYTRMYGDDIGSNTQLANAISAATKANVPKAVIEGAIARGLGKSTTGEQLHSMPFELFIPGQNIAFIADVETDNKARTLQELRQVLKDNLAVQTSTTFYFDRLGRIIIKPKQATMTSEDILQTALSPSGVVDVDQLPGSQRKFVVATEKTSLRQVVESLSEKPEVEVLESDLAWIPKSDTVVPVDTEDTANHLVSLLSHLREIPEVKAVYGNIQQRKISAAEWERITEHLDVYHHPP